MVEPKPEVKYARTTGAQPKSVLGYAESPINRASGICNAPPVSGLQLQRVFLNWAERNPQRWNEIRALGVQAAFREAWPCK